MSKYPMLTHYVSELDQFLASLAQKDPTLSPSQKQEQCKYQRIYSLRDDPNSINTSQLWKEF